MVQFVSSSISAVIPLAALLLPGATLAAVCNAPVDLVFILDESGSVGSTNFYKSIDFMKDMVARYQVGTGASDAQIAMVEFASRSTLTFDLNDHTSNAAVTSAMSSAVFNSGGTCTGWSMKMASDQVLCPTCPGRSSNPNPSIVVFLTDGNPGAITSCNSINGGTIDRIDEINRLKGMVNRIIPVGIGSGISTYYLQSLAKDMPLINGNNYITAEYSNLGAIMDDLATAACPTLPPSKAPTNNPTKFPTPRPTAFPTTKPTASPTAFPTAFPTKAPTAEPTKAPTNAPTKAPTFNCVTCTPTQMATCDMAAGRPGTCGFTDGTCSTSQCGCSGDYSCDSAACGQCTQAPTNAPTAFPTVAPTASPTSEPTLAPTAEPSAAPSDMPTAEPSFSPSFTPTTAPTAAPSAPTKAPTYWDLFVTGQDDPRDAAVVTAAGATGAVIGTLAIVAIILGVIAAVILLIAIATGVGIFAARKKLFATDLTVDGKALVKGNAISVGHKLEMTPEMAAGMLERGELTPEQYEDMGYGERLPSYSAANLVVGPRGSNAMHAL